MSGWTSWPDTPADVLAVETIPELEEIEAVAGLLGGAPARGGLDQRDVPGRPRLRSGVPVEEAVAAAASPGVVAVGVNCTPPAFVEEIVARMRAVTTLPIVVYPNSGEGWDAAARRWTGAPAERVDAAAAARWRAAGATLVGGCCRVTPDQIAGLARGHVTGGGAIGHDRVTMASVPSVACPRRRSRTAPAGGHQA